MTSFDILVCSIAAVCIVHIIGRVIVLCVRKRRVTDE